jgi:hypothetical protein
MKAEQPDWNCHLCASPFNFLMFVQGLKKILKLNTSKRINEMAAFLQKDAGQEETHSKI